ncbi:hypothetical protein J6590_002487 [Homalodisca vitripennis]|nr:hypothetical protein J6590_002487 [Homalodisca vitripennis]
MVGLQNTGSRSDVDVDAREAAVVGCVWSLHSHCLIKTNLGAEWSGHLTAAVKLPGGGNQEVRCISESDPRAPDIDVLVTPCLLSETHVPTEQAIWLGNNPGYQIRGNRTSMSSSPPACSQRHMYRQSRREAIWLGNNPGYQIRRYRTSMSSSPPACS